MRHHPRGLPASLLLSSSPLYDEFEIVRVEDHAPTQDDENDFTACADCAHLEASHAEPDASNEALGYVMDPRPCQIPNCPCGDFQP